MLHNQITKQTLLGIEEQVKNIGNSVDEVIATLQQISPNETELINKLNRMSPSNLSSEMADALRIFDKKIKYIK